MQNEEGRKIVKTPRERFKTLAPKRMDRALKAMKVLGNCANRQAYSWTDEEADQILEHVSDAYNDLVEKFRGKDALKTPVLNLSADPGTMPHPSEVG